jgi:hypothetical protein
VSTVDHAVEDSATDLADRTCTGLRPETVRVLRNMLATPAITDFPVNLTRDEARHILDLALTPLDHPIVLGAGPRGRLPV